MASCKRLILGLMLVNVVGACYANDTAQAWVAVVDTNAINVMSLGCKNNMALSALRTAGSFGAHQNMKWCAAKQQMVRTISPDGAYCE